MNSTQRRQRRERKHMAEQAAIAAEPQLVPIADAAMRGRVMRNGWGDPIGSLTHVYEWSVQGYDDKALR